MSPPLLEVSDVVRTYATGTFSRRRTTAVDGVSLRLDAGRPEIFTIVGKSGSGKTTLARMILGIVAQHPGTIRFRGSDLKQLAMFFFFFFFAAGAVAYCYLRRERDHAGHPA